MIPRTIKRTSEDDSAYVVCGDRTAEMNRLGKWAAKRKNEDFLPLSLTVLGCVLSLAAIWWGVTGTPTDFLLNILATLALLGPGLVITNVVVSRSEKSRMLRQSKTRAEPMLRLLLSHFNDFIKMGNDYLEMMTAVVRAADPNHQGFNPMPLANTLTEARSGINLLCSSVTYLDADSPPGTPRWLPLPKHRLEFADTEGILHLIERIDRETPIPISVHGAQKLLAYSKGVGLDFVDLHESTSIYADPGELETRPLGSTKVGYLEAGAYAYPPYGSDAAKWRSVDVVKYAECLMNSLHRAEAVLKAVLLEAPGDILPERRIEFDGNAMTHTSP
jgi:hypothetical protein